MQRILYVEGNPDGTIGGSFFSLFFLASGVDRARFDPVVAFVAPNTLIPRFEAAGVRTFVRPKTPPFSLRGRLGRSISRVLNFYLGFVGEPLKIAKLIRRERIALVHLNNSITRNHEWALGALLAGVPCVSHERGINTRFSARTLWVGRRMKAVICISRAVADNFRLRKIGGLELVVIPNALDPAAMRVTRTREEVFAEFGIPATRRMIGIVGNVKEWKGQAIVIEAVHALLARYPDLVCLLVGDSSPKDAAYLQRVKALIAERGLEERVILTGYRADVSDYVNAFEVLIHASNFPEPFGRVLLEGMALRKPLIGTDAGAVPEIIEDGVTGLLFTPRDSAGLASQLDRLLSDPARAAAMGEAGYRRLTELFSQQRNLELTQAVYAQHLA